MTLLRAIECFAIVTPGTEQVAVAELVSCGITPGEVESGGVHFQGTAADLYAANLHLRSVSRILVRMATFRASSFHELERHAKRVPWADYLGPDAAVSFHITSRKSKLYHQGAIEQRLAAMIGRPVDDGGQLFVVRVFRDVFTVSADASGELLHRRGYRLATAKAPLRETMAATMLLATGWDSRTPLLDPMCGSGTIPIEAALMARRIAPGLGRPFAFERWPGFEAAVWQAIVGRAREQILPRALAPVLGSDRDAGAIVAARANAERAGVAADVELEQRAISAIVPPPGPGYVVCNPPYGGRVGDVKQLRNLYAQFGNTMRKYCAGWQVALLSAHRELDRHTALPFEPLLSLSNGGIRVQLVKAAVPGQAPTVSPPSMGSTSPVI